MRDWNERRYNRYKRNGKDCYVKFRVDRLGETIFYSAEHKISLNVYRMLVMKSQLRDQCIYI